MDKDTFDDDEHQSSLDALDNMDSIHDSSSQHSSMQPDSDTSKPNQEQTNLMEESSEEEDEIVDVEEVEDEEEGFLHIDSENLDHGENEEEELEHDNNNNAQYSDHETGEQDDENEGEQSESEDESDSESNEDLSEEEHFQDHENGGFTIDNSERQYMFDLNAPEAHFNHLRDSMQQATQYDDNFDMHMNHYLDPSTIMPSFDVVQLPTTLPTTTVSTESIPGAPQQDKGQQEKPKRGRVAKSKLLAGAEQVFKDSLKNLKSERDILNFLRFVDHFLSSTYGISIFEVRRPAKKVASSSTSTAETPSEEGFVPRRKFPKRTLSITTILQSPESPLVRLNLREIINYKTFNLLEPQEKDSLLQYLPDVDKTSKEAVESMFNSHAFLSNLPTFQEMLGMGEFENNKDEYIQYVKGKKKRETMDAWKEKYYEEYWGQKLNNKEQQPEQPLPTFSFVEYSKEHANEDLAAAFPTHTFIRNVEAHEMDAQYEELPTHAVSARRGRKKKAKNSDDEEVEPRPKATVKKESENDNFVADEEEEEDEDGKPKKRRREKRSDKDYAPGAPVGKVKRERSTSGNSFRHCAYEILLREQRPLSAAEIIKIALKEGLITTTGKTPQNTLASVIYCEMKKDPNCSFTKVGPMTFGLKEFKYNDNVLDDEGKPKKKRKKKGAAS